jgi:hypothetical protein
MGPSEQIMRNAGPVRRLIGATLGEATVIKTSEFSTIAVLVAATAAVVAVQQHRERERRLPAPPAIEAESYAPTTDARLASPTGVDLAVTSPSASQPAGGP